MRLAYVASNNKKGASYYKRWFKQELRNINKLLEVKKETIWNNLKSRSKRI